jgi:thymidine phosphorylase
MDGGGEVMSGDAYFILSSERGDRAKLLSYTGAVQRGKLVLTIKAEVSGFMINHELEALETILKAHKAPPVRATPAKSQRKGISQTKVLTLPAPDRGLGE